MVAIADARRFGNLASPPHETVMFALAVLAIGLLLSKKRVDFLARDMTFAVAVELPK